MKVQANTLKPETNKKLDFIYESDVTKKNRTIQITKSSEEFIEEQEVGPWSNDPLNENCIYLSIEKNDEYRDRIYKAERYMSIGNLSKHGSICKVTKMFCMHRIRSKWYISFINALNNWKESCALLEQKDEKVIQSGQDFYKKESLMDNYQTFMEKVKEECSFWVYMVKKGDAEFL